VALAALAAPLAGCLDSGADPAVNETDQAAVTSWGSWRNVPGNTNVSLATVTLAGRLYLFDKALDNSIHMNTFTRGGGWAGWRTIGGTTDASLAATVCWDGIYLFQKGMDGRVYFSNSYDGSSWAGWAEVPGSGQTDAALNATCMSAGEQGLRVYMKGLDGHVYENVRSMSVTPVSWTTWSGWHEVGDGWVTNVSLGSMQNNTGFGELVLLFKGLNNHSYWKVFHSSGYYTSDGSWSSWKEIGGTTDTALSGAGNMIAAKGINDQSGYYNYYLPGSDSWSGWGSIGVGTTNAAYALTQYAGGPDSIAQGYYLFAKGINDNGIYLKATAPLDPPANPPPPPPPPGTTTSTATAWMQQQSGYPGDNVPIAWWTSFGNGIYAGRLQAIANPTSNWFVIYLLKVGHYSSECANADAVVPLAPGASTSDMQSLYGTSNPLLPVPIVACAGGGRTLPPSTFPISVTYTH
jgi:hypothetical protein